MLNTQLNERLYFIGDIHAQHKKLNDLLALIEFDAQEKININKGQLVFMGDLIDSDPHFPGDHLALLNQIESLVTAKKAFCLLGNHEFNAVGWATLKIDGHWARPHNPNNKTQHSVFLKAVVEGSKEHKRWITWFKTLPLFIDFGQVKAIHACWDEQLITRIKPYLNTDNSLKEEHWVNAFDETHELFTLCETLLKGPERQLPEGQSFQDKTGKIRTRKRIQWWDDSAYPEPSVPIIVGHYTLDDLPSPGLPKALSEKVICVDYNAVKENNPLVCCQFELMPAEKLMSKPNYIFHYVDQ